MAQRAELLNVHTINTAVDLDVLKAHVVVYFKGSVVFILGSYVFSWIYFSDRKIEFKVFFRQTSVLF